jgi:hypothetical protein
MGFNAIDIEKLTHSILDDTLPDKSIPDKHDKPTIEKVSLSSDKATTDKLTSDKPNNEKKKKGSNTVVSQVVSIENTEVVNEPVQNDMGLDLKSTMQIQLRDIHKFLFELWNAREMNIVINLYREMETKQKGTERDYIYNNIMQYCEMKENKLYQYIEQNSSVL